jgi:hypothetical protein
MVFPNVKARKLSIGLPFNLGQIEFEPDETQQRVAWELYVETCTRSAAQPANPDGDLFRENLDSLHRIFQGTRESLRAAGPGVAQGENSVGAIALAVLNKGVRMFWVRWHPLLQAHEEQRPAGVSIRDHEQAWEHAAAFYQELAAFKQQMKQYTTVLEEIAGMKGSLTTQS